MERMPQPSPVMPVALARVKQVIEQYEEGLITEQEAIGGIIFGTADRYYQLETLESCNYQAL